MTEVIDFKLDAGGDLELSLAGDIALSESIVQAVRIRLLWFLQEWRLGPGLGVPYFEEILGKNPNEGKVRHRIREAVMGVEGVVNVQSVALALDKRSRQAAITAAFSTGEESFQEEVKIKWHSTD